MRLRIALVAPLPPPRGGISTWTEGLLRVGKEDSDIEILHVDSAVHYRSPEALGSLTRIIGGLSHGAALLCKTAWALLFRNIDVVHICTSGSLGAYRDLFLVAFARILRVPTVVHVRFGRLPALVASPNWETAQLGRIFKLSRWVIVLDSTSAEAVRVLTPGCSVSVIPNPAWKLDEVMASTVDCGESKVLVFVGHVIPAKGIRELVLACRDILDPAFKMEIVGPVQEQFRQELEVVARARDGGKWLTISGQVENEEALARMAGGFAVVLPSYTEGFPNVVLEAMMLGKPVIATPAGAIPEMLSDGGDKPCGVCVPIGDVDALRNAIKSLLNEPGQALEMGQRGRERVMREYSAGAVYPQYKSIWKSAVIDHNPAAV